MNQSLKSVIALLIIVALAGSIFTWATRGSGGVFWSLRLGSPVATIVLAWLLVRAEFRKDIVPDYLKRMSGSYFECQGLCFFPGVNVEDGICVLLLFFQNRYEGMCDAEIVLKPSPHWLSARRPRVETIRLSFSASAAAFGYVRIPYPVPARYQGRRISYDVCGAVNYPSGRGRMLRFRDGTAVGPVSRMPKAAHSALSLLLVPLGILWVHRPARCGITLPTGVAEAIPADAAMTVETLADYQPPTRAFPVIQH